jgi:hypothetical protein
MSVELTEALLRDAAGWDVMKRARAYIEQDQVLSSHWSPPLLRGVVQGGEMSFRPSMVIKSGVGIENLCNFASCRSVCLKFRRARKPTMNSCGCIAAGPTDRLN